MREFNLLHGSSIRLPRSIAKLTSLRHVPKYQYSQHRQYQTSAPKLPIRLGTFRQLHASPRTTGFTRDILSSFTFGTEHDAATIAARKADAELEHLETALNSAPWIHQDFKSILLEGHPDRIFYALQHEPWKVEFIRQASDDLLEAVLHRMPPSHFLGPFLASFFLFEPQRKGTIPAGTREDYVKLRHATGFLGHFRSYTNAEDVYEYFLSQMREILKMRMDSRHGLSLPLCTYFLKMAGFVGDPELADTIFYQLMSDVQPDLEAYNAFMQARVWAGSHDAYEKDRRFVTKRMLNMRLLRRRPRMVMGHRVGPKRGIRGEMIKTLDGLIANGFEGDEATFSHLIVAMGRENDLEGVKGVLRSVWNIDLDQLEKFDEEEIESPTYYDHSSALRPTPVLLCSIAHVYAINRKPLFGLKLVDYISRHYNLKVPHEVWFEILTEVFRRSYPVVHPNKEDPEQHWDRLPASAFDDVWAIMTDQPHNMTPSLPMANLRSNFYLNIRDRERVILSAHQADQLISMLELDAQDKLNHFITLCEKLIGLPNFHDDTFVLPSEWFDQKTDLTKIQVGLEAALNQQIFLVRGMIQETRFPGNKARYTWEREILPDIFRDFTRYIPNDFRMFASGGKVEFYNLKNSRHRMHEFYGTVNLSLGLLRLGTERVTLSVLKSNIMSIVAHKDAFLSVCWQCGQKGHSGQHCNTRLESSPRNPGKRHEDFVVSNNNLATARHELRQRLDLLRSWDNPIAGEIAGQEIGTAELPVPTTTE